MKMDSGQMNRRAQTAGMASTAAGGAVVAQLAAPAASLGAILVCAPYFITKELLDKYMPFGFVSFVLTILSGVISAANSERFWRFPFDDERVVHDAAILTVFAAINLISVAAGLLMAGTVARRQNKYFKKNFKVSVLGYRKGYGSILMKSLLKTFWVSFLLTFSFYLVIGIFGISLKGHYFNFDFFALALSFAVLLFFVLVLPERMWFLSRQKMSDTLRALVANIPESNLYKASFDDVEWKKSIDMVLYNIEKKTRTRSPYAFGPSWFLIAPIFFHFFLVAITEGHEKLMFMGNVVNTVPGLSGLIELLAPYVHSYFYW